MGGGAMLPPVAGSVLGGLLHPLNIPRSTAATAIATAATTTTTTTINPHTHHPPSSHLNLPLSANFIPPFSDTKGSYLGEASINNLGSVGGREDRRGSGSYYGNVFGDVPSRIEVEKAMSDFQKGLLFILLHIEDPRNHYIPSMYMLRLSTSNSESSWLQQMLHRYNPRMLQSLGYRRIHDAYRMLQTDPMVQRMVVSLSSDRAVWDAILNNEAVQDFQGLLYTAKEERPQSSNEESDLATLILNWIFGTTKSKVVELIEKFVLLVNEILQLVEKEKPTSELTDLFEEKVRSSLLLSVVILLIVVVTRSHTG